MFYIRLNNSAMGFQLISDFKENIVVLSYSEFFFISIRFLLNINSIYIDIETLVIKPNPNTLD